MVNCCCDSDVEPPNSNRRRKLSRRHSAPAATTVTDPVADVAETSDSIPPSVISSVLMVEVENVAHDPYKTTEEMKVLDLAYV